MLQSGQVGPAFFEALARVRTIHDNCRSLLRSHHQRAGLELMDQMSHYQEGAYETLCRWVLCLGACVGARQLVEQLSHQEEGAYGTLCM